MDISVFGLGYVGTITAACLASQRHQVIGIDVNSTKVAMINTGESPVIEAGLEDMVAKAVSTGCLRATTDVGEAMARADLSLICVGTPNDGNGGLDLTYVERVCGDIGQALNARGGFHVVVVRSTVLPGSTERWVIPVLEAASGRVAGRDFGVCVNPEFLREGSAIADFHDPPLTLIGEAESDDQASDILANLYDWLSAPLVRVPYRVAEMLKYVNNVWHALKVVFSNEIGTLCKQIGVDSHQVMDIFCMDEKLNLSGAYLRPGFAFGGSCLPKDLRALLHYARHADLHLPVLEAILSSNQRHVERALEMIQRTGRKRIGILGMSFKAGTDDLRESPMVTLIERLIGKGYAISIYDRNVSLARLQGANKAYIEREIPHIASLMRETMDEVLTETDVIVIGNRAPEFTDVPARLQPGQKLIDLARLPRGELSSFDGTYEGICW